MITVVALAVGALAVGIAWGKDGTTSDESSGPDGSRQHETPSQLVEPARRAGAERSEVPNRTVLPDRTVVPVRPVGTDPDGSLAVPDDIRLAGWWRGSARLGDPFGSTVLAAHVDSLTQGLGPYASLLTVRAGQRIEVSSLHLTQSYSVVSLALVPRGTLAQHPRIFSPAGPRRLTLVTCAGPYVAARGGYQNLAVVTARPLGDVARKSGP